MSILDIRKTSLIAVFLRVIYSELNGEYLNFLHHIYTSNGEDVNEIFFFP
jgi:hypothetical protein